VQGNTTITRGFDALNRVTSYNDGRGHVIGHTYDANGNLRNLTYEPGKTVTYGYDSRNRVVTITDWTGRTTALDYDGAGRLKTTTRPNGTVRTNTWDLAGQLTMVRDTHTASGDPVVMLRMEYDAAGRLENKFEVPPWAEHPGLPARLASHPTGAWEGSGEMPPNVRQHPKGDMSGNEGVN